MQVVQDNRSVDIFDFPGRSGDLGSKGRGHEGIKITVQNTLVSDVSVPVRRSLII